MKGWLVAGALLILIAAGFYLEHHGYARRGVECAAAVDQSRVAKLEADLLVAKNNEKLLREQLDALQKENADIDAKVEAYESGLEKAGACPATQRDIDSE